MSTSSTTDMERTDEEKRTDTFAQADKLDEQQILEEMKGHVIEQYFYQFQKYDEQQKKYVTTVGVTLAGVKYLAELSAKGGHRLSIVHVEKTLSPDGKTWLVDAYCQDIDTGEKRVGAVEQERFVTKYVWKDGKQTDEIKSVEPKPFAYTMGISKAQRNALRAHMDEVFIQEGYKLWLAKHEAEPSGSTPAKKQADADLEKAKKNAVVAEVKEVGATAPLLRSTEGMTRESLAYELRDFAGDVEVVDGVDGLIVNVVIPMVKERREALNTILIPYKPVQGIDKGKAYYRITVE